MNAEEFIEENYYGLKIDCPKDIQTIYQALEDYANEQLRLYSVIGRSEQLPCNCEKHRVKSKVQDFCGNCGTTML